MWCVASHVWSWEVTGEIIHLSITGKIIHLLSFAVIMPLPAVQEDATREGCIASRRHLTEGVRTSMQVKPGGLC